MKEMSIKIYDFVVCLPAIYVPEPNFFRPLFYIFKFVLLSTVLSPSSHDFYGNVKNQMTIAKYFSALFRLSLQPNQAFLKMRSKIRRNFPPVKMLFYAKGE